MAQIAQIAAVLVGFTAGLTIAWAVLADPAPQPLPWEPVDEFFYSPTSARLWGPTNAVYVQTHLSPPQIEYGPQAEGVWHLVDLTGYGVPDDAKAAFLSGMILITHGSANETAGIKVSFRRFGETTPCAESYLGQALEAHVGGGQRSTMSTWVPLADGDFEFCYVTSTGGNWPGNSAYGINLSLQMWAR